LAKYGIEFEYTRAPNDQPQPFDHGRAMEALHVAFGHPIKLVANALGVPPPQMIEMGRKHGVPVFEDECYADLTWDGAGPPSLYAMDPQQVIHIGSFSKTLAPSLRLGYVVAVPEVMNQIVACKREADSGTGALDQMVVAEYFSRNFGEHVDGLTQTLHEKLEAMVEAVEREFGTTVEKMWKPKGGIFLWLKLPDRVDVTKLVGPAAKAGIEILTQDVASQAGPFGVRVNCIAPEIILTDQNLRRIPEAQRIELADVHPLKRLGTPEDVAHAALFLASESATWITGIVLDVAGGAVMIR